MFPFTLTHLSPYLTPFSTFSTLHTPFPTCLLPVVSVFSFSTLHFSFPPFRIPVRTWFSYFFTSHFEPFSYLFTPVFSFLTLSHSFSDSLHTCYTPVFLFLLLLTPISNTLYTSHLFSLFFPFHFLFRTLRITKHTYVARLTSSHLNFNLLHTCTPVFSLFTSIFNSSHTCPSVFSSLPEPRRVPHPDRVVVAA